MYALNQMSLLTYKYEKEKKSLDDFVQKATARFLDHNLDIECVGPLTKTPGIMFEMSNVYETTDDEMRQLKDIFYSLGARNVSTDINTMTQTVYFSVEKTSAHESSVFSGLYKYVPPLPIILCMVLCLYKYQNGTMPLPF